ncbi:S-adenosyl-L-methionine-dependent methyltransferase [Collybia nuda]|uniref:S-adenosyl-L-methionine-dependent methyltransferase n=1 Tax=Collybia nuda TaxID=64659 RepID=A0A9P6CET0_9AGAR|nr:S-adenosyl-L-methionine-dependent methyltransferase [Collybia nuda]
MIPTPDLSHLTKEDFEHVYEPAEDTFLLLDALEVDAQDLKNIAPTICLEIGSGSGCVLSFIGGILGPSTLYLSTDINPHACRCTRSTGAQNKVSIDPINVGFASPLYNRLKHAVDLIVFNPPYVPTFEDEVRGAQDTRDIQGSWAGGLDGMGVTGVFLEHVEELLSLHARFYLVAVKDNNLPKIQQNMLKKHGLQSEVVLQRRAGREHLFVLRFVRNVM